ncbi:kirola-like [Olea europaea var. sylvestris]|uniref:kirola-like n=1 Tax=Olea europaea var. sylvestris TaxID=158386 RepID=UPI000C1D5CE4|nr:kirola-like [Olea europaea var. sylvestris]
MYFMIFFGTHHTKYAKSALLLFKDAICIKENGETVGTIYTWKYTYDGKPEVAKEVIEPIDEEKRSVTFKLIEGDLKKVLKAFKINFPVEIDGDIDLTTWTLEYEKLNDDVKDPLTL